MFRTKIYYEINYWMLSELPEKRCLVLDGVRGQNRKFVFVDTRGNGDYELQYPYDGLVH